MKILLVDIGNTRIKWCVSDSDGRDEQSLFVWHEADLEAELDLHWGSLDKPESIAVSNVAGETVEAIISNWCEIYWKVQPYYAQVDKEYSGLSNSYSEPDKLGVDRWLAMIAAWDLWQKKVCIIDCGSAVTIDVIDSEGFHKGGMIAPGLSLSGRILTDHTHALAAEQRKDFPMLANNTEDAINSGCYHQFVGGIEHVIDKIQQQFGADMEYIITGGDAEIVLLALGVEMQYEPDLILQGLVLSSK